MSNITMEDKRKIAARAFFQDNPDQYEDYHEAAAEFLNTQNTTDSFINFCAEVYLKPQEGHTIFVMPEGHVVAVREADGYMDMRTEITQDEGEAIEEKFQELADSFPDLSNHELLEKMDWKKV